jgi:hypothetical protein
MFVTICQPTYGQHLGRLIKSVLYSEVKIDTFVQSDVLLTVQIQNINILKQADSSNI